MRKMEKGKPISQIEVARIVGVSRTTVSFVLNNTRGKHISEKTRQQVIAVARSLGYKPDPAAVNMATSREGAMSLFVSHSESAFSDAYIVRLLEGMGPVFHKNHYDLRMEQFRVSRSDYVEAARRGAYSGIILLNTHANDPGVLSLKASKLPFVVIGSIPDADLVQVDIDNGEAASRVAEYLLSIGHRDIAVIAHAPTTFFAAKERLSGFFGTLGAAGVSVPSERIRYASFTEESGYVAMRNILDSGSPPTAVFATNDMAAYGAMRAIEEAGFSIPDDISVAGFDDDVLSCYTNPPLTTMMLPAEGIGRKAAETLLRLVRGGDVARGIHYLPTNLTVRLSCREMQAR